MKISFNQYSCYAPFEPDISHGMMGPSQISIHHATNHVSEMCSQESDGLPCMGEGGVLELS